ncbi:MAG: TIGR01212 family radical SAM protein [Thermodesulfovibrionales bacterium]|nr:TIGR01212 family radical SAM protein [Thermodesulfovibrionales bacterium]
MLNLFGIYMKKRFGTTVYKVNVDAGFTCPNRDGTVGWGGCIYCNNDSFRPPGANPVLPLKEQIKNGISHVSKRYGAKKFLVYFQPYTNTYAPVERLEEIYREALSEEGVIGLAIGTRPDCVDEEKLSMIEELAKRHFILIEYGLQSIYDKTLEYINRGHDYKTFLKALEMTAGRGIHIGAHIILGFPTETREEMLHMADVISELPVEFLKIHQLQVVKDTVLEKIYINNPFHTFSYEEYIDLLVAFLERLSPDIVIQRLFATAPDEILIAPRWDLSRHKIINDIITVMKTRQTFQGNLFNKVEVKTV